MANLTIDEIVEQIAGLSAMDLADLSKAIQDKFGVTAAAPVTMMAGPADGGGAEAAEQTEFDVVMASFGDKKIQVIKAVRELTGLGLKEAKEVVDSAPSKIKEGVAKDEAEAIKTKLEEVGATIEIK